MLRTFGVILCGALLCFSLLGANVALGVDRGPMDPDHATASLDEADVYEAAHAELLDVIEGDVEDTELAGTDENLTTIVRDAIDPDLLRAQVERNADRVYTFLEDESAELVLTLDRDAIETGVRSALVEDDAIRYADFGLPELDAMQTNATAYETERLELRSDILAEFDADRASGFGQPELVELIASEDRYEAQIAAFQERIATAILERANATSGFGQPRLEAMRESESSFAETQTQFREDRKEDIQERTDRDLSEEELERAYQDQREEIIDATETEIEDAFTFDDGPPGYDPPADTVPAVTAEALATDMSYSTFQGKYDTALADLEADLIDYVATGGEDVAAEAEERVSFDLPDDVPGDVSAEVDALEALVIEAATSDVSYETFVADYETVGADLEAAIAGHAWDERDEYADEIDAQLTAATDDVPEGVAEELDAIKDVTLEASLTDLEYDAFRSQFEDAEASVIDEFLSYAFDEEEVVPTEVDLTEDVEQEAGQELDLARTGMNAVGWAAIGLALLSGVFALGIVVLAGSGASASLAIGAVSAIVGGGSFAGTRVIPGFVEDAVAGADVPSTVAPVIPDLVAALLSPWATQSLGLIALGIVLVGAGLAVKFEIGGGETTAEPDQES